VDNNTFIDEYFYGEPAVSFLIEEADKKILFDLGYSDIFLKNAQKMGVNILDVDFIIFSHGHNDHTWGIQHFIKHISESGLKRTKIVAHAQIFNEKTQNGDQIGSIVPEHVISKYFDKQLSKEPVWLSDKLVFLGEIARVNGFENKNPIGKVVVNGLEEDDFLMDDSAMVYRARNGLVIITG